MVDGMRRTGTRAEKIVKEQARGKARARALRRKRFGLFQFDFSSVAVALTTIRRRGTVLFSLFFASLSLSLTLFYLPHSFFPSLSYRCFTTPSLFRVLSLFLSLPLLRPLWSDGTNEWVTPRCAHRTLVNRVVSPLRTGPPLLSGALSVSLRTVCPHDVESERGCSTSAVCAGEGAGLRVGALVHRYRKGWTPLPTPGGQEFTGGAAW